jgi:hypothetical protein
VRVDRHDGEQHQHRSGQRVEEKLERRIVAPRSAPDTNDQEHRDQRAFEEQVEQHQVERAEHADHQRFEHQERDHVFLDALGDVPACNDAQRHDGCGQHDKRHRNAVHAHVIGHQPAKPGDLVLKLEAGLCGIEARPGEQRQQEVDHRHRKRGGPDVAPRHVVIAADHPDEQRTDQRQEGERGEDIPAGHQWTPANMYQVISSTSPIIMAKA